MQSSSNPAGVSISYPNIPKYVVKYLHSNLKLMEDKTIQRVLFYLHGKPFDYYSKSELDTHYAVCYNADGLFAKFRENNSQYILGAGSRGVVKLLNNLLTGDFRAIKTSRIYYEADSKKMCENESSTLYAIGQSKSQDIIIRNSKKSNYNKASNIMPLAGGLDLFEILSLYEDEYEDECEDEYDDVNSPHKWPEMIWLDIAIKIAEAELDLQQQGFFHKDIKGQNIFWDLARQKITLIDFNVSDKYKFNESKQAYSSGFFAGTATFIAPELIDKRDEYLRLGEENAYKYFVTFTEKTEVYALGILLTNILFKKIFMSENHKITSEIRIGKKTCFETDLELGAKQLIQQMTHNKPNVRPSMKEVVAKLHQIRDEYRIKYSKDYSASLEVYRRAQEIETSRLQKIHADFKRQESHQLSPFPSGVDFFKKLIESNESEEYILQSFEDKHIDTLSKEQLEILAFWAAIHKHPKVFTYFAKYQIDIQHLKIHDFTPAMLVASNGDVEGITLLKELGIDVNAKNSFGKMPADYAAARMEHAKDLESYANYAFVLNLLASDSSYSSEFKTFPYIPDVVVNYLQSNLKLLDEKAIERVRCYLKDKPYGHYSKSELFTSFGVYYNADGLFAKFREKYKQYQLGEGTYGAVKWLNNLDTGEFNKVIKTSKVSNDTERTNCTSESMILNLLKQTKDEKGQIRTSKKTKIPKFSRVMNFAQGVRIYEIIEERNIHAEPYIGHALIGAQSWPDYIWLDMAIKTAEKLKELHDLGVFHKDISFNNVMWNLADQTISLIDYGHSKKYSDKQSYEGPFDGTPIFIAYELVKQKNSPIGDSVFTYTEKTEVYSLGMLFKFILLNYLIKFDTDLFVTEECLAGKKTTIEDDKELGVKPLIQKMTDPDASKRCTMNEVIQELLTIRDNYTKKYPAEFKKSQMIYKIANQIEQTRNLKIYTQLKKGQGPDLFASLPKSTTIVTDNKGSSKFKFSS